MPHNRFKLAILLTLSFLAYCNAEKAVDDIDIEVDNADVSNIYSFQLPS